MANRRYGDGWYTKVICAGDTDPIVDIGDATLTNANQILSGYIGYLNTGEQVTGSCLFDVNSSEVPTGKQLADADKILTGYAAYAGGQAVLGTMPQGTTITIDATTDTTTKAIPQAYYVTGTNITLTNVEPAKIVNGETLFGVQGTGGGGTYQTKTVSGVLGGQTVNPDTGFDAMTSVIVGAIAQTTTANTHGYTLTIG